MERRLIVSVESIETALLKTEPPQLLITVQGYASSTGWTNPALELIDEASEVSPDGVLDFHFKAQAPSGIVLHVLTPIAATFVWTRDAHKVVAVRVVARTNEKSKTLRPPVFTTMALGEETPTFARPWPFPEPLTWPRPWPRWPTWPGGEVPPKPFWPGGENPPKPPTVRELPPTGPIGEDPFPRFPGDPGWTDPIPDFSPFGGGFGGGFGGESGNR